jgi:hypothetical protein
MARAWWGRPSEARATQTYLCILAATSLVLVTSSTRVQDAVLRSASTNLSQLGRNPVAVLVSSACWLQPDGIRGKVVLVAFAVLVMVPLEAWLGTGRWLVAFAVGHVGATLVTAAGLSLAVRWGYAPRSIAHTIDVGYSYGALCLAGLLVHRLPRRTRLSAAAVLVLWSMASIHGEGGYTAWGHLSAILIGLALWPLARGHAPIELPRRVPA